MPTPDAGAGPPPAWAPYPGTILRFEHAEVDLRRPVGPSELAAMRAHGLRGPFAVVTAANPRGREPDPRADEEAFARVRSRANERAFPCVRCDGASPDGLHVEHGFAIGCSRADARALACEFRQSAFFWFDGRRFWIEPGLEDAPALALPLPEQRAGT